MAITIAMSLKPYHVLLDSEKVATVRKTGQELSSFLRSCMEERPIILTEGGKVEGSALEKLSKKFEALEVKILKMDIDYKTAQNNFNVAYKRIFNAMRRMGIEV